MLTIHCWCLALALAHTSRFASPPPTHLATETRHHHYARASSSTPRAQPRACDNTQEPKISIRVRTPAERDAANAANTAAPSAPSAPSTTAAADVAVSIKPPDDVAVTITRKPADVDAADAAAAAAAAKAPAAPPARSPQDEALFQATQSANCSQILEALQAGANPNMRDVKGRTSLHFMAGLGLAPACVLLIHFGAEVDATDELGLTPLHMASGYANAQSVRVLLAAGADETRPGDQGTPLEVVAKLGDYQLREFFEKQSGGNVVERMMNRKDEKLEKLKRCAEALMDVPKVREEEVWDELIADVLRLIKGPAEAG